MPCLCSVLCFLLVFYACSLYSTAIEVALRGWRCTAGTYALVFANFTHKTRTRLVSYNR